ncbi:hypothetical protein D3C75_1114450 [compost metagenome]
MYTGGKGFTDTAIVINDFPAHVVTLAFTGVKCVGLATHWRQVIYILNLFIIQFNILQIHIERGWVVSR